MNAENNLSQMRRGVLEMCILAVIQKKGEAYASDIIDELRKVDLLVVEGTLYPLLTRLKNEDMLTYRWVESRTGPPRKYYRLTATGRASLEILKSGWQKMATAVGSILNDQPNESNTKENA